ncbi:MAG: hypothetical protein GF329_14165 [Candidatus Lokiarchaeota archaeon]|nr:hypothetical protein [Candidatus Lokiarchaeota archaeon]
MDLIEQNTIMVILTVLNLYVLRTYPRNYYLHSFFMMIIVWVGVLTYQSISTPTTYEEVFVVSLILFNEIINIFYLNENLIKRRKKK